jgi:hypothetical protein
MKRVVSIVSMVLALMTSMLITAQPANAYIAGCTFGFSSAGAFASCDKGDSAYYQVKVLCMNRFTNASRWAEGPWVPRGGQTPSTVTCSWYERYYGSPWAQGS